MTKMNRFILAFVLTTVWLIHVGNSASLPSSDIKVCDTEICKETAKILLASMDKTQDPCQDFFQFACGGYIKEHPLPEGKSSYGSFDEVADKAGEHLKAILESPIDDDIPEVENAKLMYSRCMKKEDNTEYLQEELKNFRVWPILQQQSSEPISYQTIRDVLIKATKRGAVGIFNSGVFYDLMNIKSNMLAVSQAPLPLGREYILDPDTFKEINAAYRRYIATTVQLLGAPSASDETEKQIDDMIEFERKLANVTLKPEEQRDMIKLYNKTNLQDLQSNTDPNKEVIDWTEHFQTLVGMSFNDTEPVQTVDVRYLKNALDLIRNSDKITVLNYLLWNVVTNYAWNVGGNISEAKVELSNVMIGTTKERARWLKCSESVKSHWGFAVSKIYVDKHFPEESKQQAEEMIRNVHRAFMHRLDDVEFLDEPTRETAEDKARGIRRKVGYPDWIHNETAQHEHHKHLPNMTSNQLANAIGVTVGAFEKQSKQLRKISDRDEFAITPAEINAVYQRIENSILFPAAILQQPFFAAGRPEALNYGGIGTIVGHEITHGFDDMGSQFDKNGNLKRWWPDAIHFAFIDDTKCFIEQYNTYCPPELTNTTKLCVNGKLTLGENIADNGGLEQAFTAYRTWLITHEDSRLPGLEEYSPEQLFFLNFGHLWCTTATPQHMNQQIFSDNHSLERYRINGPLSNSKRFAETFQCAHGPMNRGDERCTLW